MPKSTFIIEVETESQDPSALELFPYSIITMQLNGTGIYIKQLVEITQNGVVNLRYARVKSQYEIDCERAGLPLIPNSERQ